MMNEEIRFEKLAIEHIDASIALIRHAFPEVYLIPSIYRSKGIANYVKLELNNPFQNNLYYSLVNNGALVGTAELKSFNKMIFLNMIAVDKKQEGKGYGSFFLDQLCTLFKGLGYDEMQLDVFGSNFAKQWYKSVGFSELSRKNLIQLSASPSTELGFKITNYATAETEYRDFGFSLLKIVDNDQLNHEIGRIENDLIIRSSVNANCIYICEKLKSTFGIKNIFYFKEETGQENNNVVESLFRLKKIL